MSEKKNIYLGGYVVLENMQVLQSKAWKELNGSAIRVYIFLRSKDIGFIKKVGEKEIKVPYSIIEKETGLSTQSVRNAIVQLENTGFIDQTGQGGLKSGRYGMNTYRLSRRFFKYGTGLFEEGVLKKEHSTGRGFEVAWKKKKAEGNYRN